MPLESAYPAIGLKNGAYTWLKQYHQTGKPLGQKLT